jgi:hypothetical protein
MGRVPVSSPPRLARDSTSACSTRAFRWPWPKRLRIPSDALESWDEHAPGFLESLGNALVLGSPSLLLDPAIATRPHARDVAAATRQVLIEAAATPPLIIVGHGAQVLFQERERSLHLRLAAPLSSRVERIRARRECDDVQAVAIANHVDGDRALYVKEFLGRDVRDPLLYDLQINTGRVAMADAVELIRILVE